MGKTKFTKTKPRKGESRSEYDEAKQRCNLTLTPTAIASLDAAATALGISRSELVERYARSLESDWQAELTQLEKKYHVKITTPFEKGELYFASATQLGFTGWNGKPDYEASGTTLDEAVKNLVEVVNCTSGNDSYTTED